MAQFREDESATTAFFRRLREGLNPSVSRPLPGTVKATSAPIESHGSTQGNMQSAANAGADPPANRAGSRTDSDSDNLSSSAYTEPERKPYRVCQFEKILNAENVDLAALRKLSWNGIPPDFRPMVWQILLGYMPTNKSRREHAITRKRKEYQDSILTYHNVTETDRQNQGGENKLLHQILIDLPRTCPDIPFYQQEPIQRAMERILYIWSVRHPASGYVQGMNDLLTPLLFISMYPYANDVFRTDVAAMNPKILMHVEADAFWCMTKLLDNIQDHYTFSQPGQQRMMLRLEDLVNRLDSELHTHFQNEGLLYLQFSFRWMNCLFVRELPLRALVRLWDTYLSEEESGFENFHVYVCAVFLKTYKDELMKMSFSDMLEFLQELPTFDFDEKDVEPILSQAYILSTLFDDSPSHLN